MLNRRSFLAGTAATLTASVALAKKRLQPFPPLASQRPGLNPNAYFVAPEGGNDANSGSITQPFATIAKALNLAAPGYTVYCFGGRYLPTTGINFPRSGQNGRPITLQNYPGHKVLIDGSAYAGSVDAYPRANAARGALISLYGKSYITIEGLEVARGPLYGIHVFGPDGVGAHWNIVRRCYIHHTGWKTNWEGTGLKMLGVGSYNLFEDIDSHYNQDIRLENADGMGISLIGAESVGNVARRIRCGWNSDDGVDCYNTRSGTIQAPVLYEDVWTWKNGFSPDGRVAGDGNGLKLGGQKATSTAVSGGHTFRRFLTWGNRVNGVDENSAKLPCTLESGVAWKNGGCNYYLPGQFAHHLLHDCVSSKPRLLDRTAGSIKENFAAVPQTAFLSLNDTKAIAPRPADGSLPNTDFLRLGPA